MIISLKTFCIITTFIQPTWNPPYYMDNLIRKRSTIHFFFRKSLKNIGTIRTIRTIGIAVSA
jgi:hypothetical protein